jgi:hypothetical protein
LLPESLYKIKYGSKILEISSLPLPLPSGERRRVRGKQNVRRKFSELNV